jgi:selenocysteine lyase/cysteine desulfurase
MPAPRLRWIDGSATFTTVLSSMIMNRAKATAPSVHHFLFSLSRIRARIAASEKLVVTRLATACRTRQAEAVLAPSEYADARTSGYLDTATYGLPPYSTARALERALSGWQEWEDWHAWERDGEECRRLAGAILGCASSEIALVSAVSVAAGVVAASLPARAGDNVVCYEGEFRSALYPFLALEGRGVEVRVTGLVELAAAVDARTQLVAVSTVQSADGRVADLDGLRETGAPIFLDGTQSVGARPLDLEGIDFVAFGAYKWLLCPRGIAFLRIAPARLADVEPWHAGWKSAADGGYYGIPRVLHDDARRFDVSLPWLLAAAAIPSLGLVESLGAETIARHDLGLARRFSAGLGLPAPESAIVQVLRRDAESAAARLDEAGVRCSVRAGSLRFAFHLYNDEDDVDRALDALG